MAPTTIHRSQHNPYTVPASSTKAHSTSTRFIFRTAAALVLSTSFTLRAFAQNPSIAKCSAYTTVDEKTLYVQGGSIGAKPTNQFYALDLTVQNFTASSPPWKALSLGAGGNSSPASECPSMTLLTDRQSLLVWNSVNIASYNMATDSWQPAYNLPVGTSVGSERVVTVANSGAGTLYALAGASNGNRMLSWTASSDLAMAKLPMPDFPTDGSNDTIAGYAAGWSTTRNSMLLVGGYKGRIPSPYLFEYTPASNKWQQTKQTGAAPPPGLFDACMVPAYNGTKMIVFGGEATSAEGGKQGTVYILDVKTMKWTKGASVATDQARSGMACAAALDNFVVWGGSGKNSSPPSQPMMIYNMNTNAWTNQFIGPLPPPPPPSPTPSPSQGTSTDGTGSTFPSSSASSLPSKSNSDSSDTSKNAYLIGGFAAAVVVLAIIAILGYRRYRTKKPKDLPKEEFYADFEAKHPHHHHADERGQPMDEDYLRERMAHHPQRSPRISPPILDTYSERSRSPDPYDDDDRRVPDEEEYHQRGPSPDEYNRRSSSPVYEMPPPVLMSRSTPTPPPSRRAAVAAAAAAAYSDDGRHGSKASYQGSDGGRRAGGRGGGRGSHTGSGSGSAAGSGGGGGGGAGGYVSDSDDPTTPRHDMTPRSYSPSRYRQPRYPHPNTPSPRPTHSQSSPSHQHQQQQQQFEPHSLSTLTPVHHGNRVRPQNNNSREQQAHPDDFRAMDDATLYSQMKVMMQAVDERNRR